MNYRHGNVVAVLLILLVLSTPIYALTKEEYMQKSGKLLAKLKDYQVNSPDDKVNTIEIITLAGLAKSAASKYEFTDKELETLKARDAEFRKVLEERIRKQGIDKMNSAAYDALLIQTQNEFELDDKPNANRRIYTGAILYPTKLGAFSKWGIGILALLGLVYAAIKKGRRLFSGIGIISSWFGGTLGAFKVGTYLKKLFSFNKKAKEELPVIVKNFKEKEALIRKNEEYHASFKEILEKESLGGAREEKVMELEKEWLETVVEPLQEKNAELEKTLDTLRKFLNYFEKGEFEKKFVEEIAKDNEKVVRFEKGMLIGSGHFSESPKQIVQIDDIGQEFEKRIGELKEVLADERQIVIKAFPDYNKLANALRNILMRLKIEDVAIAKERDALKHLQSHALKGDRIQSLVTLLGLAAQEKKKLFAEEQKFFEEIQELEKKVGPILTLQEDALKKEAESRRYLDIASDQVKKGGRKHILFLPADSPLEIKNNKKVTVRRISDLAKLQLIIQPPTISKSADVIDDINAFRLFEKQKKGKSDLYYWLYEEYNEALAKEVQDVIDTEKLPEYLPLAEESRFTGQGIPVHDQTIDDPDLVRSLNRIRKRVVQLIDYHYPPLKK